MPANEASERTSARVYDSKQVVGDDGEITRGELRTVTLRLRCVVAAVVVLLLVGFGTFWWVHFGICLYKYLNILV